MGILVALLVFFRQPPGRDGAVRRVRSRTDSALRGAFERVVIAQVEISAVSTPLTAVYLFAVVPVLAERLPFSGTLSL